jgi:hypothetical protein
MRWSPKTQIAQTNRTRVSVQSWTLIAAGLLAAYYFATSICIASHRLLWFDEIITALIARLPDSRTIWRALGQGADIMPPPFFMVTRLSDSLFGHTEVAIRLPAAVAMTAGLLITFDCARRLTDGLHGLISMALLTCSFLPYYGFEARSYALYFMFAALSLWVWTLGRDGNRTSGIVFGLIFFLGTMIHYYFFLCLVPYAAWELSNWRPWRLPSLKITCGALGVLCAALVLRRPILAARQFSPVFWSKPSLYQLRVTYSDFFPDGLFLLALIIVWITLAGRKDRNISLRPMESSECVGWLFFLIPLVGYLLAIWITNAFLNRYFIGVLPGIALALPCWLYRRYRESRRVSTGIFVLLAVSGLARQAILVRHPERIDPFGQQTQTRQMLELESALWKDGKEFFVFDSAMLYLAAHQYSKHPEGYVFMPFGNQGNLPRVLACLGQFYPLELWKNEELEKHIRETALIAPSSSTLNVMRQAGFETTVSLAGPLEVVYLRKLATQSNLRELGTTVSAETHEGGYKTTQFVRSQFE